MTTATTEYLWLSVGEANYENYGDDMDALALAAYDQGVRPPYNWLRVQRNGFECAGYEGPVSYVSLYWGDKNGNFLRGLTDGERREFVRCMKYEANENKNT